MKTKGIIYYTHNQRLDEPIVSKVREYIAKAELPIVSVSLQPIDFGENFVLKNKHKGVYTLALQIITALEHATTDFVFFCEHDVLYHPSHFDFTPPSSDTFYYNTHVIRWRFHSTKTVFHSDMISQSGLCCNRKIALQFYYEYKTFLEKNTDIAAGRQTSIVRNLGFEPGASTNGKYNFKTYAYDTWKSICPNIDIRHRFCFTNRKTEKDQLSRIPHDWTESTIDKVPCWNLEKLFEGYIHVV